MPTSRCITETKVALHMPLMRGARRLRIALVGLPGAGKTTLFDAVSSTAPLMGRLTDTQQDYRACTVQVGLDEASVVDLPSLSSVHHVQHDELGALKYLLWGNDRPPVTAHEADAPPAPFEPPDLIVQVVDASNLQSHLELTLELSQLGRPVVLALNQMDRVHRKGQHINLKALSEQLGMPVVATVATMGQGIADLFKTAMQTARRDLCPLPQPPSAHIARALEPLSQALKRPDIEAAFRVPHQLLLTLFACGHGYFEDELREHFAPQLPALQALRAAADERLPRALAEEIHADGHHRAVCGGPRLSQDWPAWRRGGAVFAGTGLQCAGYCGSGAHQ